ncbi:MAG TPA: DUF1003 domain-containing protein [Syntrophorhabdaceae bacterium]|nr:DUF1003 domain-containing protein [Syntrophorhabdaceae bacterium]
MNPDIYAVAKRLLHREFESLSPAEQNVIRRFAERLHVSRNAHEERQAQLTFGQRLADSVAAFGGSWTFIVSFAIVLCLWVALNSFLLIRWKSSFDPYPYILLNLVLSMLAAIQAPVILMSQNRQAANDRVDAEHDYEVNLKAELEIMSLHEKIDILREKQWADLLATQQEQIEILHKLIESTRTGNQG